MIQSSGSARHVTRPPQTPPSGSGNRQMALISNDSSSCGLPQRVQSATGSGRRKTVATMAPGITPGSGERPGTQDAAVPTYVSPFVSQARGALGVVFHHNPPLHNSPSASDACRTTHASAREARSAGRNAWIGYPGGSERRRIVAMCRSIVRAGYLLVRAVATEYRQAMRLPELQPR
jgi:hypothetical protein